MTFPVVHDCFRKTLLIILIGHVCSSWGFLCDTGMKVSRGAGVQLVYIGLMQKLP